MSRVDRDWLFRELRQSLVLLAADGDTALTGVPDGCCKPDELALDFDNFRSAVVGNFVHEMPPELVAALAAVTAAFDDIHGPDGWSEDAVRAAPEWAAIRERAGVAVRLLDCVSGNPFRPPAVAPGWRTPTVLALAESVYADRGFDRLPVLADALNDAGCDAAELLAHLRGPGPHVRGCWALDRLLDNPDEPHPSNASVAGSEPRSGGSH